jgi:hypothetical protein
LFASSFQKEARVKSPGGNGCRWRPSVYRGLHDPVRCLVDVIEEMTANLEAELAGC